MTGRIQKSLEASANRKPQTSGHCPPKKPPQVVGDVLLGFHTRSGEQMLRQTDDEIQIGVDHRLETFSNLGSNDK